VDLFHERRVDPEALEGAGASDGVGGFGGSVRWSVLGGAGAFAEQRVGVGFPPFYAIHLVPTPHRLAVPGFGL
jgi:hypothetical protein